MKANLKDFNYYTPCPVVFLVSTINKYEIPNLAPFARYCNITSNPPRLLFVTRTETDTYKNIVETGEFVLAFPSPDLVEKVVKCGEDVENEFAYSGLTPVKSKVVRPYSVKECQVNVECKLEWIKRLSPGTNVMVLGRVVYIDIDNKLAKKDLASTRLAIDPLYRVDFSHFMRIKEKELLNLENP